MGETKNPRRVADNEAMAKAKMLKVSPQKLNLVAGMIRARKWARPSRTSPSRKTRIAQDVLKCLNSAIANAENNHGWTSMS